MSALAAQQRDLLQALFEWPDQGAMKLVAAQAENTWARGLKAYKTNGHMLAERALAAAYPVVAQLLGPESLADLARALWHAQPPVCGDLAVWGATLPAFLEGSAQLQDEPYLADVARAEWALHRCAVAHDVEPDPASLALLTTEDPDTLHLRMAPGCSLLRSAWPVVSLLGAHLQASPSLAEVGAQLRTGTPQDLLVWRRGLRPEFRAALPGELDFVSGLCAGVSLGQALELTPALDFATWFPLAIQFQLVLGVYPSSSPSTPPSVHASPLI